MEQTTAPGVKVTMSWQKAEWDYEAHSFEAGLVKCNATYEKLGLIGRAYIISSCGKMTWIRG